MINLSLKKRPRRVTAGVSFFGGAVRNRKSFPVSEKLSQKKDCQVKLSRKKKITIEQKIGKSSVDITAFLQKVTKIVTDLGKNKKISKYVTEFSLLYFANFLYFIHAFYFKRGQE